MGDFILGGLFVLCAVLIVAWWTAPGPQGPPRPTWEQRCELAGGEVHPIGGRNACVHPGLFVKVPK